MNSGPTEPAPLRWQISLRRLFGLITVFAILFGASRFEAVPSVAVLMIFLFVGWRSDSSSRIHLALLLVVLYLPYSWLLTLDFTQNSYHWTWFKMWPILPGLLLSIVTGIPRLAEFLLPWISAGFSVAIVLAALRISRRGWKWLAATMVLVFAFSFFSSYVSYALFRA